MRAVRYREIAEALRGRIAAGEVGAGELLASEAELVQQFDAVAGHGAPRPRRSSARTA